MKKHVLLLMLLVASLTGFSQALLEEGFEGGTFPPEGWTVISDELWSLDDEDVHSGEFAAYHPDTYDGDDTYLITPQLSLSGDYILSFYFAASFPSFASSTDFTVEISTAGTEASDFEVLQTLTFPSNYDFNFIEINLSEYNGQDVYIAFHIIDDYGTGVYLDDITVGVAPTCFPPTAITVSDIATDAATISWTEFDNAASYLVQYISNSTNWDEAEEMTVEGNSVTLTGLNPASVYNVRIQSDCNEEYPSAWSDVIGFNTSCTAITITEETPWFEDFENYTGGGEQPFVCWEPLVQPNGPFVYCGYTLSCHSGQNSAELKGTTNLLVLPEFTNDIHELRLSFWGTATYPSYGTLEVGVITDMTNTESFEVVGETGRPSERNSVGNFMGPFDFNGVQASEGRIALRYTCTSEYVSWNLDDFTVELSPSCVSPIKTSVTASNIDGHNATISWVDNDENHYSWTLYYKKSTETDEDWQSVVVENDTFHILSGLDPETAYEVYVVTNCDGEPSTDATITYTFTTDVACPAPTELTADPIYIDNATISWSSTATSFNIEYGVSGFTQGEGLTATADESTILLEELTAETTYTVYVQAVCSDEDGTSSWSSFEFTTLPSCPIPTEFHSVNVSTNSAELTWTAGYEETEWEVVYGQENFNPDTSTLRAIVSGEATYQMENLTMNHRYDAMVRAICSEEDTSDWSNRISFVTQCEAFPLPLTENFDSYPAWYSPDCWQKFETPDMSGYAYIYNTDAYSGSNAMTIGADYSSTSYGFVRLPQLETDDLAGLQVKVMAKKTSGDRPLVIGIIPEFSSMDNLHIVASIDNLTSTYTQVIASLASYTGTDGYIVIGTPSGTGSYSEFYIDDLTVEVRPDCMYPTNFATNEVGETAVTLSWTEMGTAESWFIEYGPMGYEQGTGTQVDVYDSTVVTIEDLETSTAYDFYVSADCGGVESQWVGPLTVVTSQYIMGNSGSDTITTCGMAIYDDGGPNGNHGTQGDYTLVVYPATEGSGLQINGTCNLYDDSWYGSSLTFYDGVGTDGAELGTFSGNSTIEVASNGPITINFTSGYYYQLSGFELIVQCTDCFPPTNLSVVSTSLNGATLSWSGSAEEYAVYAYSASDTSFATTSDTSYTFDDLQSSSHYTAYVKAICGETSSISSNSIPFNTACGAIEITDEDPWFEDFESYTTHLFTCWETPIMYTAENGTFPLVYVGYASSCHSGANSAELKGPELMLVLPEFTNDIHDLRLSFWATATDVSKGTMEIGVITDIMDTSTFEVVIADAGRPSSRNGIGNYMGPFDFNSAQATSGRIALRYTDATANPTPGSSAASWNLDDFTVQISPNCPAPVKNSVTVSNIDGHNATISFTDNDASHTSWTVYYKETEAEEWEAVVANTTSVEVNGLDPETTYEVYVVTNCDVQDDPVDATFIVEFTTTVSCPAPSNLNVVATSDNAVITWDGNADSYTVVCGDFSTTVTENTATITDLTPATAYTVNVTADCGSEDGTSEAATLSFSTLCDAFDMPFVETFNGISSGIPMCWDNSEGTTTYDSYKWNYYYSGLEGGCVRFDSYYNSSGNTNTLKTPAITIEEDATLKFYYKNPAGGDFSVYVLSNGEQTLLEGGLTDMETWTAKSYDLSEYTNQSIQITFVGTSNWGNGDAYIYLDSVSILAGGYIPSTCDMPTGLTVNDIGSTNATAVWSAGGTETSWKVQFKAASASDWGSELVANSTSYNLTNLTANTEYQVRVKADCGNGNESEWTAPVSFSTLEEGQATCYAPTNLTASDLTANSVKLDWEQEGTPDNWTISYKQASASTWSTANTDTHPYTLTDLAAGTEYEVYVVANCDGQESGESNHVTFSTTGVNDYVLNSTTLFPNPTTGVFRIQNAKVNIQNVEVYDVFGKLMTSVEVNDNTADIDATGYASGVYFARIITEKGIVTKRIVKK